jgi:hypothetical protein
LCYLKRDDCYVVELEYTQEKWDCRSKGARVYPVGDFLVETQWGNGRPVAVHKNIKSLLDALSKRYIVEVTLKE